MLVTCVGGVWRACSSPVKLHVEAPDVREVVGSIPAVPLALWELGLVA